MEAKTTVMIRMDIGIALPLREVNISSCEDFKGHNKISRLKKNIQKDIKVFFN